MSAQYDLTIEGAECLEAHGFVIGEPQPRDEWIDGWGVDNWWPWGDVLSTGQDLDRALEVCPEPTAIGTEDRMLENQQQP